MCWPLMKKFLTLSIKNALMLKELLAVASATDSVFQKKIYGSGRTTMITSRKDMKNTMKNLEKPILLVKGVSETIENKINEEKAEVLICQ